MLIKELEKEAMLDFEKAMVSGNTHSIAQVIAVFRDLDYD